MSRKAVLAGALLGSVVGVAAEPLLGPSGWALGGAAAGAVVGAGSSDLAGATLHGAAAGVVAAFVFAVLFGFGRGVGPTLDSGDAGLLVQGVGPFLSIAIIYGVGCFVAAAIAGGLSYGALASR